MREPSLPRRALILAALTAACAPPPAEPEPGDPTRDLVHFLRRLRRVDHLPDLEASHTAMESTWDRSGGNQDGIDFKRIEGRRNILLETDGPGCVHRLYTGNSGEAMEGTRIQIFLDRSASPVIDMAVSDLLSEDGTSPWPPPLVSDRTFPGTHFPIPFAEHIKIQLVSDRDPPAWGLHWQVTHTRYPAGTPVRSLQLPLDARERLELNRVVQAWSAATAAPPAPPASWSLERTLHLRPGGGEQVRLSGCGVIRELRVATAPATPEVLRSLRLQATWDGSPQPSVDAPLGYFFGHGDHGHTARFNSLLLGVTEKEAYARFPMPFASGAVLAFENRSDEAVQLELRLDLDRCAGSLPAGLGRFHATWHRAPAATKDSPTVGPLAIPAHRVLERTGVRGKYVGTLLHLYWPFWTEWWGEGDWLFWTDEQGWPPSYHGTGSEEYFNSGWTLFERKAVSGYIAGRPGLIGFYSLHLNDAFQFQHSVRVLQETVGSFGGQWVIPLLHPPWGTTALWYAERAQPAGSLPE